MLNERVCWYIDVLKQAPQKERRKLQKQNDPSQLTCRCDYHTGCWLFDTHTLLTQIISGDCCRVPSMHMLLVCAVDCCYSFDCCSKPLDCRWISRGTDKTLCRRSQRLVFAPVLHCVSLLEKVSEGRWSNVENVEGCVSVRMTGCKNIFVPVVVRQMRGCVDDTLMSSFHSLI